MGNLFAELNKTAEKQRQDVQELLQSPIEETTPAQQERYPIKVAQKSAQKDEQMSNRVSKQMRIPSRRRVPKPLGEQVSTQAVEVLSYQLRRILKNKVSAEIPETWKKKLDGIAVDLNVGRYELLTYI